MKKFLVILVSVLVAGMLCLGCTPTQPRAPETDSPPPWFAYRTFESETATYKVSKLAALEGDNKLPVTTEDSRLIYTLESETNNGEVCYKLTADFKLTYNDSQYIDESYRGKTDTIKSVAVFRSDNIAAVSTSKEVKLETAPDKSYSFTADYNAGKAVFTYADGSHRELTFAIANYIDNEYLFYYVRTLKEMGSALNANFNLVNWYECFLGNEFSVTPMVARYYNTEGIELSPELIARFPEGKDPETNKLNCDAIMISLGGTKTGAPLYGYYSTSPYTVVEDEITKPSKKVLTKMITYEYTTRGKITYTTEYVLDTFAVLAPIPTV